MSRNILLRVATPMVVIGLGLCTLCLIGAWHVNRLQAAFANILAENVLGMKAAQQLEISARQLRFHSFLYLIAPSAQVWKDIETDRGQFEGWLSQAEPSGRSSDGRRLLREIHARYDSYWREFEDARRAPSEGNRNVGALAAAHSVRPLTEPCRELLHLNEEILDAAVRRSEEVTNRLQAMLLLLGLGGPLGGLLSGYGIARGVRRSLHRLSVRVQDVAQQLEQDVADLQIVPGSDLRDLDRQIDYVVARVAEATERQQRQQREMLRAQQLAAVGQLAASIAHEVRNPLTGIKMLVEAALRAERPRPFTADNLRVVHDEVLRLERTVQSLLDFARPASPDRRICDLRAIVSRAADLVSARARQQGVAVDLNLPPDSASVSVDSDQFCGVLVNLFINALDAMPVGGRLSASLESTLDAFRIAVEDTGPGVSAAMKDKLFTPFQSDKPTGCGLGLSIVQRVVTAHGGTVEMKDRDGGARFVVIIPVTKGAN